MTYEPKSAELELTQSQLEEASAGKAMLGTTFAYGDLNIRIVAGKDGYAVNTNGSISGGRP